MSQAQIQNQTTFTIEQFQTALKGIIAAQARATKGIGQALLMCLYFANKESSAKAANDLLGALRKSTKQQAIIDLLEVHGNLAWLKKERKFEFFDAKQAWTSERVKELRSICEDWESFKVKAEPAEVDILKMYDAIHKKYESAKKNQRDVAHAPLMALLTEAVAKYTAQLDANVQAEKGAA